MNKREPTPLRDTGYRLLQVVWKYEPITSTELAKKALTELGWKKSTTFSVLKRLTEFGYIANNDAVVTAIAKPGDIRRESCEKVSEIADTRFGGSVPSFIATFIRHKKLSNEDADEIMRFLQDYIDNNPDDE